MSSLHDAASSVAFGSSATTGPPVKVSPRTPVGPSDRRSSRRPIDGSGRRVNMLAPVSRAIFCARSRALTRAACADDVMADLLEWAAAETPSLHVNLYLRLTLNLNGRFSFVPGRPGRPGPG